MEELPGLEAELLEAFDTWENLNSYSEDVKPNINNPNSLLITPIFCSQDIEEHMKIMENDTNINNDVVLIKQEHNKLQEIHTELLKERENLNETILDIRMQHIADLNELAQEFKRTQLSMERRFKEKEIELENRCAEMKTTIYNMNLQMQSLLDENTKLSGTCTELSSQLQYFKEQLKPCILLNVEQEKVTTYNIVNNTKYTQTDEVSHIKRDLVPFKNQTSNTKGLKGFKYSSVSNRYRPPVSSYRTNLPYESIKKGRTFNTLNISITKDRNQKLNDSSSFSGQSDLSDNEIGKESYDKRSSMKNERRKLYDPDNLDYLATLLPLSLEM